MFVWFWRLRDRVARGWNRLRESTSGDLFVVENKGRYRTANPYYYAVRLRPEGEPDLSSTYLFTENELKSAGDRAVRNPEDVPESIR